MTFDRIKRRAEQTADREGRPQVILNLNPIGTPLYVIRPATTLPPGTSRVVATIYPQNF